VSKKATDLINFDMGHWNVNIIKGIFKPCDVEVIMTITVYHA